ncbi:unnamed protein product [Rotaria socialis]|uniref:F-box domain-containing protein n=1 Tax=Rotaria socialis TaxID=392032 RepID=A0A817RLY4_9BILA|nr:unnamed protein product [Rotaria socialis]CAF3254290.1 unnamed protein product [Rotaria socialis]CAF3369618.1 unnamed protein product [Rotaria socialis]CAF3589682.1 unnamed protein product [Rotaria socialis]CAF4193126.1 unnamed protein product [Rotaria socialis]
MEYSCVQLNDLPDEVLMIILKKLANMEVLYSLVGVHKRLNRIAQDSVFTNNLTLLISSSNGFVYSLPDPILDRFCSHILPKIHQKIKWLGLESLSIERILRATNYPNLYGISLYNIQAETAIGLFTDETSLICTLKNQILELVIDISTNKIQSLPVDDNTIIFIHIFTTFTNLQYLNFGPSLLYHQRLSFFTSPLTVISTNLLKLHVYLENFNDCLYLLDGRFNQLHTLSANISFISASPLTINNKEKMPTLKCVSLHCDIETCAYDELILPLFRRMLNLEKLNLCLIVGDRKTFFDDKKGHCHIYSYPYKLNYYDDITNNFPGGIFKYVRKVSLFDEHPFEHEFFLRIAQSFPLMEKLCVCNEKRQINKQFRKSKNENQDLSIIKYPYLKELDLIHSCIDYHAQFLLDTKTCLPFDVRVSMQYELLKKVTRNFRRNTTRSNCAKMNCVYLCTKVEFSGYFDNFSPRKPQFPEHIKDYSPRAKIH